jgi:ribulose-5-phosphate 4-epimerase/fuculose-1-phosphate aldolase
MTDAERQARIDLAAAYRLAVHHGLNEGVCNHFTLMLPDRPNHFLLIGYGTHWSEVRASDLLVVDLDGNLVEGDGAVEDTAFFIHARVHKARPDLKCLMHTHQPHTLALAMTEGGRLEPASQTALRFSQRIAYDWDYQGLAFDNAEGDRVAAAMDGTDILMMGNHGVMIGGPHVAKTYDDLYYLERAAMTQILAMSTGRPLKIIPEDIQKETAREMSIDNMHRYAVDHFIALKRMLDRVEPDYKD